MAAEQSAVKWLDPLLCMNSETAQPVHYSFCNSEAVVFSRSCPLIQGENGDSVGLVYNKMNEGVFVLADGAGGTPGGNRASGICVETLVTTVARKNGDKRPLRDIILDGFEKANQNLLERKTGAGTTLFVAEFFNKSVRPYHVGDSVILIVGQKGKKKLQTISHSPAGYAMESGLLDETEEVPEEIDQVVSNLVGMSGMRIEIGGELELDPNDTLLLASDGITDNLTMDEIIDIIRKGSLDEVAQILIEMAGKRMEKQEEGAPHKPDDLSFILYRL
jgi:serine/threonine protein phosphatase PrpC